MLQWCQKWDVSREIDELEKQIRKLQGSGPRRKSRMGTERHAYPCLPDGGSRPRQRPAEGDDVRGSDGDSRRHGSTAATRAAPSELDGGGEQEGEEAWRQRVSDHAPYAEARAEGVRLPRYNGEAAWEPYEAQLGVVARHFGWTPAMIATRLCLALEGRALQALVDVPEELHGDLGALKTALRQRFGQAPAIAVVRQKLRERRREKGEKLGVLAAELRTMVRQA